MGASTARTKARAFTALRIGSKLRNRRDYDRASERTDVARHWCALPATRVKFENSPSASLSSPAAGAADATRAVILTIIAANSSVAKMILDCPSLIVICKIVSVAPEDNVASYQKRLGGG